MKFKQKKKKYEENQLYLFQTSAEFNKPENNILREEKGGLFLTFSSIIWRKTSKTLSLTAITHCIIPVKYLKN